MSTVTNIIILAEVGEETAIDALNAQLQEAGIDANFEDVTLYPGDRSLVGKVSGKTIMGATVLMGAFNALDLQLFLKCFDAVKWELRRSVQLLVKRHDDERFYDARMRQCDN